MSSLCLASFYISELKTYLMSFYKGVVISLSYLITVESELQLQDLFKFFHDLHSPFFLIFDKYKLPEE